jgi:Transposase DDE domain/Insertion element 4 transposase N-terminal
LSAKFAMVITHASTASAPSALPEDDEAAEIAARVASGPGFWTGWLAELDREGLLEALLAEDVIVRALREVPSGHKYDRVLTAKMTVICVLVACLFPGAGYDSVLATAFGLPGLRLPPGAQVPTGPALSQARKLLGEQVMKRIFELDAAVTDADLGIGLLWKGLEVTAIDGTTMELGRNDALEGEFGTPAERARPVLRVTAHVRTATFRWIGAAVGGYHDGENALADQMEGSFCPGMLNLADRGFFSMHRWIRFSGTGAHLAWRVKNSAKSVPLKTVKTLPDGSELVMLHESDGMRTRRRREAGDRQAERLPDTLARLVTFTITTRTRSGRTKTTRMRVLTTLLDHKACPAAEIAVLYAERWQIEIAFLHLKRTVRGPRRPLRGQSPDLARQEAWSLLLIHNITATAAARAAGSGGLDPGLIPFTAVLGLIRAHVAAEAPCRHCGHRPDDPLASLNAAIFALPRHRQGRQRTSGRTAAERRTRHTEEVTYTMDITKSNLPKWDASLKTLGQWCATRAERSRA